MGKGDYRMRVGGKGGWGGSGRLYGEAIDRRQEQDFHIRLKRYEDAVDAVRDVLLCSGFFVTTLYKPELFNIIANLPNKQPIIIRVKQTNATALFYPVHKKEFAQWEDYDTTYPKYLVVVNKDRIVYIELPRIRGVARQVPTGYVLMYEDTRPIEDINKYM